MGPSSQHDLTVAQIFSHLGSDDAEKRALGAGMLLVASKRQEITLAEVRQITDTDHAATLKDIDTTIAGRQIVNLFGSFADAQTPEAIVATAESVSRLNERGLISDAAIETVSRHFSPELRGAGVVLNPNGAMGG